MRTKDVVVCQLKNKLSENILLPTVIYIPVKSFLSDKTPETKRTTNILLFVIL